MGRWKRGLEDGSLYKAEIHWYEAHASEFKIKRFLDEER
jgi:hypothetical protein